MTPCVIKWFPYLEPIPSYWINFSNYVDHEYYYEVSERTIQIILHEYECSYAFNYNDTSHPARDKNNSWKNVSISLTFDNEQAKIAFILEWS